MGRCQNEKAFGISEAFEGNPEALAHSATTTVTADQIIGLDHLRPGVMGNSCAYTAVGLAELHQPCAEPDAGSWFGTERGDYRVGNLELFALQREGKVRFVRQHAVIEFRHDFIAGTVAELKFRRQKSTRQDFGTDPQLMQHVDRRRL